MGITSRFGTSRDTDIPLIGMPEPVRRRMPRHALGARNRVATKRLGGPVMHAGSQERDVFIGDNVWIGTGAVVAGAHIGHGVIVAAGAVVSGTIPDMAVAAGIPARIIRMRCRPEERITR